MMARRYRRILRGTGRGRGRVGESWVRHPFYLSYLLCWTAGVLATGRAALAATVAFMGWIYWRAAVKEEAKFAASPLGAEYRRYAARAGRFVPTPWRRRDGA